ncbi:hypothetical protein Scep_003933 [Stephania cephalantha]|uniref:Uncharacterized protein n=1 Tax=Stephania cephalantha TaxID=152367 RepID=A0AAP0PWS8_9MAGN
MRERDDRTASSARARRREVRPASRRSAVESKPRTVARRLASNAAIGPRLLAGGGRSDGGAMRKRRESGRERQRRRNANASKAMLTRGRLSVANGRAGVSNAAAEPPAPARACSPGGAYTSTLEVPGLLALPQSQSQSLLAWAGRQGYRPRSGSMDVS